MVPTPSFVTSFFYESSILPEIYQSNCQDLVLLSSLICGQKVKEQHSVRGNMACSTPRQT